MPLTQSLATPESAHSGLWSMRELKVLLLFRGRDVGPFHGRPQKKKMQMRPVGWREKTWRERCGIIDQLDARSYTPGIVI